MSALEDARAALAHPDGLGYDYVTASALVSIAESLETVAECLSEQRAEARYFFEQNEGDYLDLFGAGGRYRPTADVESPLLMDVPAGRDHGAEHER